MKRMRFITITVMVISFLLFSCREADLLTSKTDFIAGASEVDNLLIKYDLSISSASIWNDYLPGEAPYSERSSICVISFISTVEIPRTDVFATIITERIILPELFYITLNEKSKFGNSFLKEFRPIKNIHLNDGEEYTIEIIIKVFDEYQAIILGNKEVEVTH